MILPRFLALVAVALEGATALGVDEPRLWRLADGVVTPDEGADEPRAVGSLQKAWVAAAWASAHPDPAIPLPRVSCDRDSRCWLRPGHGELGLRAATARSCNTFFRELALRTPTTTKRDVFQAAGFEDVGSLADDAAIGLAGATGPRIAPRALLLAYANLATTPWLARDDVRREWLDGMRDAAEDGTAAGVPPRGFLAKTGTVRSETRALGVDGWALVLDPAGRSAWLAFVPNDPGSMAATRLGEILTRELRTAGVKTSSVTRGAASRTALRPARRPFRDAGEVRVILFTSLRSATITARNLGSSPVRRAGGDGWIGSRADVVLTDGERFGSGTWQLTVAPHGLTRVVRGSLECVSGRLVLVASSRDYAEGVVRGELRNATPERAGELAAAVLRFLEAGPRHGTEDVCDLTHCARFVGLGPDVEWLTPVRARHARSGDPLAARPYLDDEAWSRVRESARLPGPSTWSGHCGGEALSAHQLWGTGDRSQATCTRHSSPTAASWSRSLSDRDLGLVFGGDVEEIEAVERGGVLVTRVQVAGSTRFLLYDDLHRLVAERLGWQALPSPPDSFERTPGGWLVRGRGSGHRVGVCLAD